MLRLNWRLVVAGLALITAALSFPVAAAAQYLDTRTLSWSRVADRPTLAKELVPAADYRIAGAVIGAAFFGAVGGWALHEACKTQPVPIEPAQNRSCTGSTVGGAAVGGALGAGLGYVVGRLTHRH